MSLLKSAAPVFRGLPDDTGEPQNRMIAAVFATLAVALLAWQLFYPPRPVAVKGNAHTDASISNEAKDQAQATAPTPVGP